jgi:NAD(P)-dependent dehydrogenase (short-subunit alcohol dehydrogenase family)
MQSQKESDLRGKVAIVTGASRGIGRHAALALAHRGVNVVVTARSVDKAYEAVPGSITETAAAIEATGAEALAVGADLAQEDDLSRIIDATVDRFGGVDLLVNNAAVTVEHSMFSPLLKISRSDWMYHFAVNVHAPFTLTQLVTPIMTDRGGGRIINVTTGSGESQRLPEEPPHGGVGTEHLYLLPYFSSKRALDRFANVAAPELADHNIFVISVMPGWVATESDAYNTQAHGGAGTESEGSFPSHLSIDFSARLIAYFAACENPAEYTGRIFDAERDVADLGLDPSE